MFLFGLCIIVMTVFGSIALIGMFRDDDRLMAIGGIPVFISLAVMLIGLGLFVMFGTSGQQPVIGKCYQAYPHTTTVKGVDYQGVTLVEVNCP